MNHEKFWNNFTQMYRDHFKYLKLKKEKKTYMGKIDHVIQNKMLAENPVETKEILLDKISAYKLRIKEKKEALDLKEAQIKQKDNSIKSLESFTKEWNDQIQFQSRVLEAFNNKLKDPKESKMESKKSEMADMRKKIFLQR